MDSLTEYILLLVYFLPLLIIFGALLIGRAFDKNKKK